MAAVFLALEPNHKGAAISVYNLSAGLSNFLAPAIAVVLLPYFSIIGVVIACLIILASCEEKWKRRTKNDRRLQTESSHGSDIVGYKHPN